MQGGKFMQNLKNNIEHYMKLKGIENYTTLLRRIALELGIERKETYDFVQKEKSNFSKMLSGKRTLKYEFIIPLEKIFGISLARLLDENAYKLPFEKNNVPFNKGFRYYAYMDEPKLYKNELDLLLAKDGNSIITHTDEFGKTFLDYIVEYNAVNGVRYLHEMYGIKLKWYHNQFEFKKGTGVTWINFENCIAFARIVASMEDAELFNDIYDPYNMFITNGHYASKDAIFCQPDYLEIILNKDNLFKSIFETKAYEFTSGSGKDSNSTTYNLINPIINNCLRYTLEHLDRYKYRAKEILEFGIKYNEKKLNEITYDYCYICNELGGLKNFKNKDFYDVIVFSDAEVNDDEIKSLINRLPRFKK